MKLSSRSLAVAAMIAATTSVAALQGQYPIADKLFQCGMIP